MSKTGYTTIEIECPKCDGKSWSEIEFLIGSGMVPRTFIACGECGEELAVSADLDVGVELASKV